MNAILEVFPNPASTSISMKVQESDLGTQVRIYNSLGQEVLSERIASTNQMLNIEKLTEGFYFLKLEGSVVRLKVVR
ncbi:MAG: Secretion system C-terminal sorting domain [Bacteroidota bacterium]